MRVIEFNNRDKNGREYVCGRFEIRNQTLESADLFIYGDIMSYKWDDSDIVPQDVAGFLKNLDGTGKLNIYINSGGGSVFAGLAIYNQLKRHTAEKTVYIDGVAASIASVVAMAGDRLIIPSNAFLMIHKPWNLQVGNANDMRKMADDLDRIEDGIMNVYREKLADGVDIEEIRTLVQAETWLNGKDAARYFNVEVGKGNNAAACVSGFYGSYRNAPVCLMDISPDPGTGPGSELMTENEIEKEKLLLELSLL